MVKTLMAIIEKIKFPFALSSAFKARESKEYGKAINILMRYEKYIASNSNKFPDFHILLAETYARIGKYGISQKQFERALNALDDTSYLNIDEKKYLKIYIFKWLIYLSATYSNSLAVEHYKKICNDFSYDKKNVRDSFKISFPQTSVI